MNLVKLITPTNLAQERERFLASIDYHPVFEYNWPTTQLGVEREDNKSKLVSAILKQDRKEIINSAQNYFEIHEFDLINLAKDITSTAPETQHNSSVKDYLIEFNKAFTYFDLHDFELIVTDERGYNFRPSPINEAIYMSKHADFQFFSPEGEVRHEMVHVLRYVNTKYNSIPRSKYFLPTEEGLATLMQDSGEYGSISEFQHAAEYLACVIGLQGSLRDIFEYFISIGFNHELAWQRASRHKFGFIETKEPGDNLKAAIYFANSQKIRKLTSSEKLRLFVGKISLSDLEKYPEYSGAIPREKIVEFFELE